MWTPRQPKFREVDAALEHYARALARGDPVEIAVYRWDTPPHGLTAAVTRAWITAEGTLSVAFTTTGLLWSMPEGGWDLSITEDLL